MLDIGTVGFDHRRWSPGFYDAELPAEWRFLHYCNQFRALLSDWDEAAPGGILRPQLVEDSDDGFRLVLRVALPVLVDLGAGLPDMLRPLAARLAAVNVLVPEEFSDTGSLGSALGGLSRIAPICVGGDPSPAAIAAVRRYCDAAVTWRPEAAAEPDPGGGYLVVLPGDASLPRLRDVLETAARWAANGRAAGVYLEEPGGAPDGAREARILAELLGV